MTDEDPCSEQLSEVIHQFNRRGDIEPGLEVEEDALLQLRKACRILDGIRALRDIDRHYTLSSKGRSRRSSGPFSSTWATRR